MAFPVELAELIAFHFPLTLVNILGCFPYVLRVKLRRSGTILWRRWAQVNVDRVERKAFNDYLVKYLVQDREADNYISLEYLYHDSPNGCRENGNLYIYSCFQDALILAATNGHVDVVKWMIENVVIMPYMHELGMIMKAAIINGHFDLIEFHFLVGPKYLSTPCFLLLNMVICPL